MAKDVTSLVSDLVRVMLQHSDDGALHVWIKLVEETIMRRRGHLDGKAAGTWVFDGNMEAESIKTFMQKLEAGDPEALDALPQPRIGGEFAGEPTWDEIVAEEMDWEKDAIQFFDTDHMFQAYNDGFTDGLHEEIAREAKFRTAD